MGSQRFIDILLPDYLPYAPFSTRLSQRLTATPGLSATFRLSDFSRGSTSICCKIHLEVALICRASVWRQPAERVWHLIEPLDTAVAVGDGFSPRRKYAYCGELHCHHAGGADEAWESPEPMVRTALLKHWRGHLRLCR